MPEPVDLEEVILDSLSDSTIPADPDPDPIDSDPVEAPTEVVESPIEAVVPEVAPAVPVVPESSLGTPEPTKPSVFKIDRDLEKKYGIPAQSPSGRENRIPYTRVQKIAQNAAKEASKAKDAEYLPRLTEFETKSKDYEAKITDYETRLDRVARFEEVMAKEPEKFLNMLSTIPAYSAWFDQVRAAFAASQGQTPASTHVPQATGEAMPEPDQELSDGTKVYSMEGLKTLLAWNTAQAETKISKQIGERYEPIEKEWQAQQRVQAEIPRVRAQIQTARTWDRFNELEGEIVKILASDTKIGLSEAYNKVLATKRLEEQQELKTKLSTDRNKIREEILAELQKAPRSTSATTTATKTAPATAGPRSLEDIISEQVANIPR